MTYGPFSDALHDHELKWVAAAWTLPLGWAETGRWSRACQSPGLWSRAAAVCKRFSSWRAPRWPPPASTERLLSHTGSHNPKLVSEEKEGRKVRGERGGGKKERERYLKNRLNQINHRVKKNKKLKEHQSVNSLKREKEGVRVNRAVKSKDTSKSFQTQKDYFYTGKRWKVRTPPKLHEKIMCSSSTSMHFFIFIESRLNKRWNYSAVDTCMLCLWPLNVLATGWTQATTGDT